LRSFDELHGGQHRQAAGAVTKILIKTEAKEKAAKWRPFKLGFQEGKPQGEHSKEKTPGSKFDNIEGA
jgi:hypothetical protein